MQNCSLVILLVVAGLLCCQGNNVTSTDRNGKVFSLFSIVQFPNAQCTTSSTSFTLGTCYSSTECSSNGGTAYGSCAAGFGVCCVFSTSTCGTTISKNCTYITNPGFPSGYTTTGTCTFTVSKMSSEICQLRLDFATLELVVSTASTTAGQCGSTSGGTTISDALTVAGQTGRNPPVICGTSTGHHMYVDTGTGSGDTVSIPFALTATTGASRKWNIKVSQIECTAAWREIFLAFRLPSLETSCPGCTQCFTGATGNVQSYGFGTPQFLYSQQYSACFRQELGYCSIQFKESSITSPDPFDMDNAAASGEGESTADGCTSGHIKIPGGSFMGAGDMSGGTPPGTATTNGGVSAQMCGECLCPDATSLASGVITFTSPFRLSVLTAAISQYSPTTTNAGGFSLDYTQLGCQR